MSGLSVEEASRGATVLGLMTCVKVGVHRRVSQVAPQGSSRLQGLPGAHSEGQAQRAGAGEKPEPAAEAEIRPETTPFEGSHRARLCCALVAPVTD